MENIFILLALFQVKHFICDYPLQTQYMLQKANKEKWFLPLLSHAFIHALGTFIVVSVFSVELAFLLSVSDLFFHFIIDRIKASPNIGNRWGIDKPYFWWALGADQMAHHLINYSFIYIIIKVTNG